MANGKKKTDSTKETAEHRRLEEDRKREKNWKRWGPYLSERQWATVREDYSPNGTCWDYFPHDHARSRAYRWGEDGLLGITDREGRLCFGVTVWNGKDPILKERLFGLTGPEGNHGEDVKELYYFLDSTPTHSYMKGLYKYPQAAFPYQQLLDENRRRGLEEPEYEITDTGVFDDGRYFDIFVEYAKPAPDQVLIRITACNRGPDEADLHLLPTLWFRNTWIWGCKHEGCTLKPKLANPRPGVFETDHETLGRFDFYYADASDSTKPEVLVTDNHSNNERLFGVENPTPYVKDAFHRYLVNGEADAVHPRRIGTKAAPHYHWRIEAGGERSVCLQLVDPRQGKPVDFGKAFDEAFSQAQHECDEFYGAVELGIPTEAERCVARQGYAGLLWSKQFYHYIVDDWLKGDPSMPAPPEARWDGRNHDWQHVYSRDVISMPDTWEYPWFAAWDLCFHMVTMARIDPDFAKRQLTLFLREWYMHPNGQIPAYEFAFGDVNPPVHAWAAWRVYKISAKKGQRDRAFLESVFQKLLLNFTWWVNRKDEDGNNLFAGGFLGLDNIGVFDRSQPLPTGGTLQQADGTAWMAFYANTMLAMALELAWEDGKLHVAYSDMASKFFEHFIQICDAMNSLGGTGLWDEEDGFYYDRINRTNRVIPLKTRSLVGLMPLITAEVLDRDRINKLPGFKSRYEWFMKNRPDLAKYVAFGCEDAALGHGHILLAIPSKERLERVLRYLFDESEFLSDHGIRGVSKFHEQHPYVFTAGGQEHRVEYMPAESRTHLFGGNSNWRGPVWFPINYLLVEALERFHEYYRDQIKVECPTGSGNFVDLKTASMEIARRLASIFLPQNDGRRPCHGNCQLYAEDPHFRDLVLFNEYFHGDTGAGLGASHQTGWTSLVIRHLEDLARWNKNGRH